MLFAWLDQIRKKPKAVRERYAFSLAALFVTMLIGIWSLSLPERISSLALNGELRQEASVPLSGTWNNFKNQFSSSSSKKNNENVSEPNPLEELVRQAETGNTPPLAPTQPVGNIVQIATTSAVNSSASSTIE